MDKYEYRVRAEQIKSLLADHLYTEAMEVCDTVDWKRVKSMPMLCTVSEIYKINRRYEDSKEVLLMAYDRYPGRKMIVYALCELSIKMEETVQAVEYWKEFCKIAPRDTGRYILQYRIYEAQDVSLEERIAVLEEFKKKDYRERWAYELAYLYHRIGLATKCVEECDELILWFGEGKYVLKALELKKLHRPLTSIQEEKYAKMTGIEEDEEYFNENDDEVADTAYSEIQENMDNTINVSDSSNINNVKQPTQEIPAVVQDSDIIPTTDEDAIQVKVLNVDKNSTLNLQAELSKSMQELFEDDVNENVGLKLEVVNEQDESTAQEISSQETEYVIQESNQYSEDDQEILLSKASYEEAYPDSYAAEQLQASDGTETFDENQQAAEEVYQETQEFSNNVENYEPVTQPSGERMENILSQDYDGQISMVVPEPERIEKQITGQIDFSGYLEAWEKQRKTNQKQRIAAAMRKSLEQTNNIISQLEEKLPGITGPLPEVDELAEDIILPEEREEMARRAMEQAAPLHYDSNSIPEENERILPGTDIYNSQAEDEELDQGVEEIPELEEEYDTSQIPVDEVEDQLYDTSQVPVDEVEDQLYDTSQIPMDEVEDQLYDTSQIPADEVEGQLEYNESEEDYEDSYSDEEYPEDEDEETEEYADEEYPEDDSDEDEYSSEEVESKFEEADIEDLFVSFLNMKKMRGKIKDTLAASGMNPTSGNIVITGNEQSVRVNLALSLARCKQRNEVDFTGKMAKISAEVLNTKDIRKAVNAMNNGALLIEHAGSMTVNTLDILARSLNHKNIRMLVILEDEKSEIKKLSSLKSYFDKMFDVTINIPTYSNDELVEHAKQYALEREYTIDDMGVLALYTRIDEMQSLEHFVTISEVEEIMEDAIAHVDKKNLAHLKDVLFARRYDKDDLIIIREKDFVKKR